MEAAQEEAILRSKENNTHVVIKGKRTKRQRPQSPIPLIPSITANSPSGGGGGGCDGGDQSNDIADDNMTSFSPATSAEILQEFSTEEEEDMANCLILLAQGQSRESPKQVEKDHADGGGGVYKFNSRRFLEAAATGTGKAGYYVYECKTCNRTFPSFQALGGHRASHKKPKAAAMSAEEKSSKQFLLSSDEEEAQFKKNDHLSSISFQSSSRGLCGNNRPSNKVHECSICGVEFTSGQALGGHMRRHRAPITGNKFNTTFTVTPPPMAPLEPDQEPKKPRRTVLSLDLDLNLPAPEDDHREPKFPFATKQQQQQQQQQPKQQQPPLVFSARTLVDCHY
ncbi:zinc finger protein ZAT5-like [Juglans microcarpa x Juglans regia]|uniref:zinc finger protein ZAT5-like n=1 Tax=Juglans microcarpa x Juglans regia TaxID=2249226 RepID=UPI001B7F6148|nr:zinc finger protein ZAT5-like [Juglans microcarpa x Juglans regia]